MTELEIDAFTIILRLTYIIRTSNKEYMVKKAQQLLHGMKAYLVFGISHGKSLDEFPTIALSFTQSRQFIRAFNNSERIRKARLVCEH